jgi:hypothetical protein
MGWWARVQSFASLMKGMRIPLANLTVDSPVPQDQAPAISCPSALLVSPGESRHQTAAGRSLRAGT